MFKKLFNLKTLAQKYPHITGQSKHVRIYQVGPRDGLQNQKKVLEIADKVAFIDLLSKTGLKNIEVGAFVSPKWVPQMASSKQVFKTMRQIQGVNYACLVPNQKGMQDAIEYGVEEVSIFASATEEFSKKNINCTIQESIERFRPVMKLAKENNIRVRGYVSMVLGCPYEGDVKPEDVKKVAQQLLELGCYEVSLGDTIGKGTVESTTKLLEVINDIPTEKIALHFHDTFGNAIPNILVSLQHGYRSFDSSASGLGGCPYSMKPVGNVCTENVLLSLEMAKYETGIDTFKVIMAGKFISEKLNRQSLAIFA